ncbi:MAG TPA: hypothetical protein PLP17_07780 [Oligoflexia bacterium]|nr:hypothetical protein [Oligoflexia bacterium]
MGGDEERRTNHAAPKVCPGPAEGAADAAVKEKRGQLNWKYDCSRMRELLARQSADLSVAWIARRHVVETYADRYRKNRPGEFPVPLIRAGSRPKAAI